MSHGIDASPMVEHAVHTAVLCSFAARPMRGGITVAECRRRLKICEGIWLVLRLDQRWSVQRVCDHFYRFLIAEIDGQTWAPDPRSVWTPGPTRTPD